MLDCLSLHPSSAVDFHSSPQSQAPGTTFLSIYAYTCLRKCVYEALLTSVPLFEAEAEAEAGDSTDYTPATSTRPSPAANLARREYTLAVQSNSYNEIWSTVRDQHRHHSDEEDQQQLLLLDRVLQPNRECVEDALRHAKPNTLTRLVSAYFDHSENTTHLCLLLHRCLFRARSLYAPLHDLLDLLPSADDSPSLSQSQCDHALDVFLQFHTHDNPFPSPDSQNFRHIRGCFSQLKQQFDRRLRKSRSAVRLFCRPSAGTSLQVINVGLFLIGLKFVTEAKSDHFVHNRLSGLVK